jgi:hypothetical protein
MSRIDTYQQLRLEPIAPVEIQELVGLTDPSRFRQRCIAVASAVNQVALGNEQKSQSFVLVVRRYFKIALAFSAINCFALLLAWLACGEVARRSRHEGAGGPPAL